MKARNDEVIHRKGLNKHERKLVAGIPSVDPDDRTLTGAYFHRFGQDIVWHTPKSTGCALEEIQGEMHAHWREEQVLFLDGSNEVLRELDGLSEKSVGMVLLELDYRGILSTLDRVVRILKVYHGPEPKDPHEQSDEDDFWHPEHWSHQVHIHQVRPEVPWGEAGGYSRGPRNRKPLHERMRALLRDHPVGISPDTSALTRVERHQIWPSIEFLLFQPISADADEEDGNGWNRREVYRLLKKDGTCLNSFDGGTPVHVAIGLRWLENSGRLQDLHYVTIERHHWQGDEDAPTKVKHELAIFERSGAGDLSHVQHALAELETSARALLARKPATMESWETGDPVLNELSAALIFAETLRELDELQREA